MQWYNKNVPSPVISLKNVHKYFGNVRALNGISFKVEKGDIFAFLGPNGAGKTTTINLLMGFMKANKGSIKVLKKDAFRDSSTLKKKIGFLPSDSNLYQNWTAKDHFELSSGVYNSSVKLAFELADRLKLDVNRKIKELSSGNKQKVGIILAFMNNPEILVLDEPTNSLDPILQSQVYELITNATKRGSTVFFSSHNLAEVDRICNKAAIIKQGKIITVETISKLKSKRIYSIHITSRQIKKIIKILDEMKIANLVNSANNIVFDYKGDINKLIHSLSNVRLDAIELKPADLETIFAEYYE